MRRYQVDYIVVNRRYWKSVKIARTYPGADPDSDNNPNLRIISGIGIKLKKVVKAKEKNSGT